jgi:periplasmic protein TonB
LKDAIVKFGEKGDRYARHENLRAKQGVQMLKQTNVPLVVSGRTKESPDASATNRRILFGDSLLDSTAGERKSRTWATLVSVVLQCFVMGFVLLLPLWFTEALPKQQLLTFLEAPPPPPPPPPPPGAAPRVKVVKVTSNIADGRLRTPSRIPAKVQVIKEDEASPPVATTGGVVGGVPGGIPGGQVGGVLGGIIGSSSSPVPLPTLSRTAVQRVRVSQGVINGLLVSQVKPTYPRLAQQARVQGDVVLKAIIDKQGNVQHLQVLSGHPLLAPAAIAAVQHWHYKPFLLNGEPVEVETTITVNFRVQNS